MAARFSLCYQAITYGTSMVVALTALVLTTRFISVGNEQVILKPGK
jgi:hypothetical protein